MFVKVIPLFKVCVIFEQIFGGQNVVQGVV